MIYAYTDGELRKTEITRDDESFEEASIILPLGITQRPMVIGIGDSSGYTSYYFKDNEFGEILGLGDAEYPVCLKYNWESGDYHYKYYKKGNVLDFSVDIPIIGTGFYSNDSDKATIYLSTEEATDGLFRGEFIGVSIKISTSEALFQTLYTNVPD